MTIAWKKTNFLGVRYREHKTRKHGGNRPDKCFYIHYKVDEKTKDEAVGWSSEGVTAEGAFKILSQLRENIRLGKGPRTFAELRAENEQEALREQNAQALKQAQAITFSQFWESEYFPAIQATKKPGTISSERWLYTKWIAPAIGHVALKSLSVREVEGIITKARNNKRAQPLCAMSLQLFLKFGVKPKSWRLCLESVRAGKSPSHGKTTAECGF